MCIHAAWRQSSATVEVDMQLCPLAFLNTEAVQVRHLFACKPRNDEQVFAVLGGEKACTSPPGSRQRGQLGPGEGLGIQAMQFTEAPIRTAAPEYIQLVPNGRHDMERPGGGYLPLCLQDLYGGKGEEDGGGQGKAVDGRCIKSQTVHHCPCISDKLAPNRTSTAVV